MQTALLCPVCQHVLKNIQYEEQILDICSKCGGIWLDKGELPIIVDSLISKEKVEYQTIKEVLRKKRAIYKQNNVRKCPCCKLNMETFNYFGDSNIFLDKCNSCKGIWADKGEIRSTAKYLKGNPDLVKYARALTHTDRSYPIMTSSIAKSIAVIIACIYLSFASFLGGEAFLRMMLFLIMPLACIFFGEELSYITGVRFRLTFVAPVVTKESSGSFVVLMGWVLLFLPIIQGILLFILL